MKKDQGMIVDSEKEWELGLHGPRPDEIRGHCTKCSDQSFLKVVKKELLCRRCRGVCEDCGREDVPTKDLKECGVPNQSPILCADCTVCRMY